MLEAWKNGVLDAVPNEFQCWKDEVNKFQRERIQQPCLITNFILRPWNALGWGKAWRDNMEKVIFIYWVRKRLVGAPEKGMGWRDGTLLAFPWVSALSEPAVVHSQLIIFQCMYIVCLCIGVNVVAVNHVLFHYCNLKRSGCMEGSVCVCK